MINNCCNHSIFSCFFFLCVKKVDDGGVLHSHQPQYQTLIHGCSLGNWCHFQTLLPPSSTEHCGKLFNFGTFLLEFLGVRPGHQHWLKISWLSNNQPNLAILKHEIFLQFGLLKEKMTTSGFDSWKVVTSFLVKAVTQVLLLSVTDFFSQPTYPYTWHSIPFGPSSLFSNIFLNINGSWFDTNNLVLDRKFYQI